MTEKVTNVSTRGQNLTDAKQNLSEAYHYKCFHKMLKNPGNFKILESTCTRLATVLPMSRGLGYVVGENDRTV